MSGVAGSTPPAAPNELERIQQAFNKWDGLAVERQQSQKRFGLFTALLGPVAVLLLTVQILAFPHAGPVALTLIAAELAALMIALSFGFFSIGSRMTGCATVFEPRCSDERGSWCWRGSDPISPSATRPMRSSEDL